MESFELFSALFSIPEEIGEMIRDSEEEKKPQLFSLLKPIFPEGELETIFEQPEHEFVEGTFHFKVKEDLTVGKDVYLTGSETLLDLHDAIQEAFGLSDDHLFAFYMDGVKFGKHAYNSPMDVHGPYADEVRIGEFGLFKGQRFLYLYDFGDEWGFDIEVV
jgi:hypothetical protein